jgi:hypothetical protein
MPAIAETASDFFSKHKTRIKQQDVCHALPPIALAIQDAAVLTGRIERTTVKVFAYKRIVGTISRNSGDA